jgi:hypothetical protein
MQAEEIAAAEKYRDEYIEKRDATRERYERMLDATLAWVPPTIEHAGLYEFMVKQLEESLEFDCGGSCVPRVPDRLPVSEYRAAQIAKLAKAHADRVKSLEEERDRVRSQNEWVRALRDSLNPTKEAS